MATKLKTGHICPNKSAKDRATEFSKELYEESGLLFCRTCESSIDHKRKSTIIDHLESKKHKLRKEKKNSGPISNESTGGESSSTSGKRQSTIDRGFAVATTARDARHAVANDLVCAMVAANIPLEKADNPVLRDFFVKHVRNGGSISGSTALRERVSDVYGRHKEYLKSLFSGQKVYVVLDETTDERTKLVLNILLIRPVQSDKCSLKPYLVDTIVLERTTAATVGGALLRSLALLDVQYEDVVGMVTDGAQYMKACFRDVIKPACVNCVHLICIAHCLNLVGEVLRKNVPRLDDFVAKMKTAFRLSAAKRRVYMQALVEAGVDDPMAPPSPVVTRWYSWLQAVQQHARYFSNYGHMLPQIQEEFGELTEL